MAGDTKSNADLGRGGIGPQARRRRSSSRPSRSSSTGAGQKAAMRGGTPTERRQTAPRVTPQQASTRPLRTTVNYNAPRVSSRPASSGAYRQAAQQQRRNARADRKQEQAKAAQARRLQIVQNLNINRGKLGALSNQIGPKAAAGLFASGVDDKTIRSLGQQRKTAGRLLADLQLGRQKVAEFQPVTSKPMQFSSTIARGGLNASKQSSVAKLTGNIPFARSFSGKDNGAFNTALKGIKTVLTAQPVQQPSATPGLGNEGSRRKGNIVTGNISTNPVAKDARSRSSVAPFSQLKGATLTGGFAASGKAESQQAGFGPGALWTLDKLVRPLHAQAGAVDAVVRGKPQDAPKEFAKGFSGKQKKLYSDVLKSAGVKNKAVRGVGGFAGDVLLDPLTYVTFGRSSAARIAEEQAVKEAEKTLATGGTLSNSDREAIRRLAAKGELPGQKTGQASNKGVGIGLRAFGKKTPLVGVRSTAKVSKTLGVSKVTTKLRDTGPSQGVLESFAPDFRPKGVDSSSFTTERRADRARRADQTTEERRARRVSLAVKKEVPKREDQRAVIDAIEAGQVDKLPEKLQRVAVKVSGEFQRVAAREGEVGKLGTVRQNYVYHLFDPKSAKNLEKAVKKQITDPTAAGRVITAIKAGAVEDLPSELQKVANAAQKEWRKTAPRSVRRGGISQNDSARQRKIEGTLAEIRQTAPGLFEEDLPTILNTRLRKSAAVVADEKYRQVIGNIGRPVVEGGASRDQVAKIQESVTAAERGVVEADKIAARGAPKEASGLTRGQEVTRGMLDVQKRRLAEAQAGKVTDVRALPSGDAVYRVTREDGVKKVYPSGKGGSSTVQADIAKEPGKYVILPEQVGDKVSQVFAPSNRSSFGAAFDRFQANIKFALTQPNPGFHWRNLRGDAFNAYRGGISPADYKLGVQGVRRINAKERAQTQIDGKVADALTSGGVEIQGKVEPWDQLLEEAQKNGAVRSGFSAADLEESRTFGRVGEKLNRWSQNREDIARLAQYISARKQGATAAEASDQVAKFLYDYGDLTHFEKTVARRILLFYTFKSRNTRSLIGSLLTKPGKLANYEKAREEFQRASGLPIGFENNLKDYEARGVPFANPFGGGKWFGDIIYPSDPITDLNSLSLSPGDQVQNIVQSADFFTKLVIELSLPKGGYSTFFGDVIQDPKKPLVPAPNKLADFLGGLPGGKVLQQRLGMQKYRDTRSGKMIWGWPGKIDYVARSLPETNTLSSILTDTKNSRGVTREQRLTSWALGIRSGPYDPTDIAINQAFDRKDKLTNKRGQMIQLGTWRQPDGRYTRPAWKVRNELRALDKRLTALKTRRGDANPKEQPLPSGDKASPDAPPYVPGKKKAGATGGPSFGGGTGAKKKSGSGPVFTSTLAAVLGADVAKVLGDSKTGTVTQGADLTGFKPVTAKPVGGPVSPTPAALVKALGGKPVTAKPLAPVANENKKATGPAPKAPVKKAMPKGSSDPYVSKIEKAAKKNGIRPELLYGVWGAESSFSKGGGGENSAGAAGPFQFIKSTADSYGIKDRGNFDQSVNGAAKYLGTLVKQYGEKGALAAYNSGDPNGASRFSETRNYVPKVLDIAKQFPGAQGSSPSSSDAPKGSAPKFIKNPDNKDITKGDTPEIARRLSLLGKKKGVPIYVISGYRTPARSVAVGGFADDPHTQGKALDIGVGGMTRDSAGQLSNADLASVGLVRPFGGAQEINHIQLADSTSSYSGGGSGGSGGSSGASSGSGSSSSGGNVNGETFTAPSSSSSGVPQTSKGKAGKTPTVAGATSSVSDEAMRKRQVLAQFLASKNPTNPLISILNNGPVGSSAQGGVTRSGVTPNVSLKGSRKRATSTYGNDPKTGYKDSQDNNQTSSGISNDQPGIATMDKGTLGGWYVYRAAAGKYKGQLLGVQRIETGPGAIKDGVDKNAVLVRLTGLKQGNSYPTGLKEEFKYVGKKPPSGRQVAPGLIVVGA